MESPPNLESLYEKLREQIQHEDNLVNHRLTWLLAVQGFLFAISAVLFTSPNLTHAPKTIIFFIIGVLGILFGISSYLGIKAAQKSLKILHDKWEEDPPGDQEVIDAWRAARNRYPPITYVGTPRMSAWITALGFPNLILLAWVALMIFVLFDGS